MYKLRILLKFITYTTLVIWGGIASISSAEDAQLSLREYLLKAKVINSISNFTSWPSNPTKTKPNICILGNNTHLFEAMTMFYQHESNISPKIIQITSKSLNDIEQCQIVYIAKLELFDLKKLITHLNKKPILLFSDNSGYAELGVHINLYIDNNKVRFEVNHDASKRAGLEFSSQFLRLAKIVKGDV